MAAPMEALNDVASELRRAGAARLWGEVDGLAGPMVRIAGLKGFAAIGDRVEIARAGGALAGEIIALEGDRAVAMALGRPEGVALGARTDLSDVPPAKPSTGWLGCVVDAYGEIRKGDGLAGDRPADLFAAPPGAALRRGFGARLDTGSAAFDTVLPLCAGQRVGLFAGAGVGKSSLIGRFAQGMAVDVVVVGLIGERGREVARFVSETVGPEAMKRCVVVASTSDEPAPDKLRAARLAMATAERFRDEGRRVLLLMDSLTRFAEAHREVALAAGETPSLRAFPPSTAAELARLVERAGPGAGAGGDITAVFSVLVAGSDMDEPVADMVRGLLDGHVVLSREIAERGRFPAIDLVRSVSRSLPEAASADENVLIGAARSLIAKYEQIAPMVQAGLYAPGADPLADRAIAVFDQLDAFLAENSPGAARAFERLALILNPQSE